MKRFTIVIILISSINSLFAQKKSQSDWQQDVSYIIDVRLDDNQHMLRGELVVEYTNNSPNTLDFIYFHLWPNAYKNGSSDFAKQMLENGETAFYFSNEEEKGYIDSIDFTMSGEKLTWSFEKIDIAKVMLNKPLGPGESISIYTPFKVKVPKVFSRLGHEDQDYFITQWFPKPAVYDVNGWNQMSYLNQGEFYSEFGTFRVNVTLPLNYTVVATGTCRTEGEFRAPTKEGLGDSVVRSSKKMKTVSFYAENVHDFAWFASKRFGYVSREVNIGDKKVMMRIVASEPNEVYLDAIETALNYYSDHAGNYPYEHATVVHGELKAGGGMEYPMITLCDFMNEEVIVHEVGHNWFYGILANDERTYPWMDESINSYFEGEALKKGAEKASTPDINGAVFNVLAKDEMLANEYQAIGGTSEYFTEINYGVSVYGIGANAFGYLRDYLGDDEFFNAMHFYYDKWKFKHPLPNDMKEAFEFSSGKDLDWFFDELINSEKNLDYGVKEGKDGILVENRGDMNIPIPVAFMKNNIPTIQWEQVKPGYSKTIAAPIDDYDNVVIDPNITSQDMNSNNDMLNSKLALKMFTGRDKKGVKEIYYAPTLGWNAYNKWMLGITLHNYSFSNKKFQYQLSPMFSFSQKNLNGLGNIHYSLPGKGIGQFTEIGVGGQSFDFVERGIGETDYRYAKVAPYVLFNFARSSHRSPIQNSLRIQHDHIWLTPNFDFNDDTLSGPNTYRSKSRLFFTATYLTENKRTINPYSFQISAEYGAINQTVVFGDLTDRRIREIYFDSSSMALDTSYFFPNIGSDVESDNFMKISGLFNYKIDIGIKNKPLELRVFGAYLLKSYPNTIYKNSVGSVDRAGYFDYKMDDVLMHRNAQYGLFRNQISNRAHFSRFVGPVVESDKWMLNATVTVPLPGKIPLKPYLEVLTYNDIKSTIYNTSGSGLFYNLGIEVEVIPNVFEVFFNLAQTADITTYQENSSASIDNFGERITFVLDLNNLRWDKLKRRINIF